MTSGSNHIRYSGPDMTLRVTTDAPIDYILKESVFNLSDPINFVIGPDETLPTVLSGSPANSKSKLTSTG